jgi:DNA repair exonuclease SbcCD nuclease subunit
VAVLPGNHDHEAYSSGWYFGGKVSVLDDPAVPLSVGDVQVWGVPWDGSPGETPADMLRRLRRTAALCSGHEHNVLLFHGELLDSFYTPLEFGGEGPRHYMPVHLSHFSGMNVEYVLAGHFHTRFDIRKISPEGYFVYPGSPCPQSTRETGKRKACLVQMGDPPVDIELAVPYYLQRALTLDPLTGESPKQVVVRALETPDALARLQLTVDGYFDGTRHSLSEEDLARFIEGSACPGTRVNHLYRDVSVILQDPLFMRFTEKLESLELDKETEPRLYHTALRAMMLVKGGVREG